MSKNRFFLEGDCPSRAYRNVRDSVSGPSAEGRRFIEELWPRYRGLEDQHFLEDARTHFLERFWEMYLGVTLIDHGLALTRVGEAGPDFSFQYGDMNVFVEAVVPGPGNGVDSVDEPEVNTATEVPTDRILLRFTNSVDTKRKQFQAAIAAGICGRDAGYVVAFNSCGVPHAAHGNTLPYFVQALLPIGAPTLVLNRGTGKVVDSYYAHRDTVAKASGAPVSTALFLDAAYSFISAAISSSVDCVNRPAELGADFVVLHNPSAAKPLDYALFGWCQQYVWNNYSLQTYTG